VAEEPRNSREGRRAGFAQDFRRFFLRGLALVLPPMLTVIILLYSWDVLSRYVGQPINSLIRYAMTVVIQESRTQLPESDADQWVGLVRDRISGRELAPFVPRSIYQSVREKMPLNERMPEKAYKLYERYLYYYYWDVYHLSFIGLLVAVVFVYFIGHFLATFIGNALWRVTERTVFRLPIVRALYPTLKEVVDFLLSEQKREYNRVVAVEYPRRGIWSLGMVTGEPIRELERVTGCELITIFIPYTPYSVTGYTITVPRSEVLDLNVSVEDAVRFVMSGGLIRPNSDAATPLVGTSAAPVRVLGVQSVRMDDSNNNPQRPHPSAAARPIRVGTRGSLLARAQATWVVDRLRELVPGREIDLIEIKTSGDRAASARLREIGGEGVFTKELQQALVAGEIDVAVHSLKDLPTTADPSLVLAAIPARAPAFDVLVAPQYGDWRRLPTGGRIGTSSPRRRGQLLRLRSDLVIEEIRGNVPTRLRKIEELGLSGIVLAHAGLHRLGMESQITYRFTSDEMLPAPGQGALGIECRFDHRELIELLQSMDDANTRAATTAERAVLNELRGGCHLPLGAFATVADNQLGLRAGVFCSDGSRIVADSIAGSAANAESLGRRLAEKLLAAGAQDLIEPSPHRSPTAS
jgi:hydroxymethylbilane synthase